MISFVVCLSSLKQFKSTLLPSIEGMGEIITMKSSKSICEAYNKGFAKSTGEHVCFIHEDCKVLDRSFPEKVELMFELSDDIGLLGPLGFTRFDHTYVKMPQDVVGLCAMREREIVGPIEGLNSTARLCDVCPHDATYRKTCELKDVRIAGNQVNYPSSVAALDGFCLSVRRDTFPGFDEQFSWHMYDMDLGLTYRSKGLRVMVFDTLVFHDRMSRSGLDLKDYFSSWSDNLRKLEAKWKNCYPSDNVEHSGTEWQEHRGMRIPMMASRGVRRS